MGVNYTLKLSVVVVVNFGGSSESLALQVFGPTFQIKVIRAVLQGNFLDV